MSSEISTLPEPVIEVDGLTKAYHIYDTPHDRLKQIFFGWHKSYYRDFLALQRISFQVRQGESVGVIGRNGAGKSTLLQLLTGTLTPTTGTIRVRGKVAAVLELGAGFNPEFSGRENIYLYSSLFELDRSSIDQRFDAIVEFSGLADFIDQPIKTFSSGMQARLAFSVIAHVDADILIIDEALAVGDAYFTQKCMRFLRKFKERGTIFFVSHDLAAVTSFCDQAIWLEGGRVRDIGAAKTVCEKYFAEIYASHTGAPTDAKPASEPAPEPTPESAESENTTLNEAERDPRLVREQQLRTSQDGNLPPGNQIIECFGFNADTASFGTGAAIITAVEFENESGATVSSCEGGNKVCVRIRARARDELDRPILGFIIKDRLGQPLIGGNTFHAYKGAGITVAAGGILEGEFHFELPILAVGDYSIVASAANGTLDEHVQLHWMHDAVLFKVVATSIEGVIVGAPLSKIVMTSLVAPAG